MRRRNQSGLSWSGVVRHLESVHSVRTEEEAKETRVLGNDVPKIVTPLLLFNSDSDSWGLGDGQAQTDGGAGPVVESSHKTRPMSGKTFQASGASGFLFPTHISISGGEHTKPSASQGL